MGTRGLAWWKAGLTAAGTCAIVVAGAAGAGAASVPRSDDLDPATRANITDAMEGEALAHVTYRAYAAQADRENLPDVADLYRRAARTELREHFTEQANLTGVVGGNVANLRDATKGESYEATTMYRKFAEQARADGDPEAAELFAEIADDEADHREKFLQAERAVTDPSSGAAVPTDVKAKPADIRVGRPTVSSERTLENLRTAMKGEALAFAKYTLYGDKARETGQPRLARLFHRTAAVERTEHFAEQANLAGAIGDTAVNLCETVKRETHEGRRTYPDHARQAAAAGDTAAARVFEDTARDEQAHAKAFSGELSELGEQCAAPS